MNQQEYLDILHTVERLKDTTRHCTTSKGRAESVAEHSWRISLMAFLLSKEFPDVDMNRVMQMCLIHDLGECFTGDIPTFIKTTENRATEEQLLMDWVHSLPPEITELLTPLYQEMEEQQTLESKIYKSLDKLEAVIQHNESPIQTWEDHEYDLNKTYAWDVVAFSDWMHELRANILEETEAKIAAENPTRKG